MSLDQIHQLVGSIAKSLNDQEKIATPVLAVKLAKASEAYPCDHTIGAMARVISKMASNNTIFISRAELRDLYTRLYSRDTKFASLFQDELGKTAELKGATVMQRDNSSTEISSYGGADQVLANALQSVFDKSLPVKMYSQPLADQAKRSVASTLDSWNLNPTSLEVSDGNDKFLVIKADYETPKGITSFYVPVEVIGNKVAEACVFMGNSGPQDLNHTNLKTYLTTYAGAKLSVGGTAILGVLTTAATEGYEVSDAEMAVIKLNASRKGDSEFAAGQIVGQKTCWEPAIKEVELPKHDQFMSFEKQFTSPHGQASWKFGADKVSIALDNIARELKSYGHKNPQITVSKSDDNTVFYSVALDAGRVGFVVPVKIAGGKITKPSIMLCNGSVSAFSQESVNELYKSNSSDYKAAAAASPQFGLKPSDVLNNLRKAIAEENYAAAEDALNVLANSGDAKAYAIGFEVYADGLAGHGAAEAVPHYTGPFFSVITEHHGWAACKKHADFAKKHYGAKVELIDNPDEHVKCHDCARERREDERAKTACCSMIVKSSASEHPICGHTGLPIHKVYQDQYGNCLPLYRKGMAESYEGAMFNNSKIFGV